MKATINPDQRSFILRFLSAEHTKQTAQPQVESVRTIIYNNQSNSNYRIFDLDLLG